MTDKLSVYNGALGHCGSRPLASLAEAREARRQCDWAWARGIVDRALQAGQWDFAARSVMIDYSNSVDPQFGLQYAFDRPADMMRVLGIWSDETMQTPLTRYQREGDYLFADIDVIYLRYVSNDEDYGADYAKWPPNFTAYVELLLASEISEKLTGGRTLKNDLLVRAQQMLGEAKSTDAADDAPKMLPRGSWARARAGGWSRDDRGSNSNLTG
ncbi:MAG: hypothetical protein AB7F22_17735 [Reyranella sp.]|uniref:hypothetical protein n=1 Tax=Reyranella sp. TaxID=1929291 RepID=UPI003D14934C